MSLLAFPVSLSVSFHTGIVSKNILAHLILSWYQVLKELILILPLSGRVKEFVAIFNNIIFLPSSVPGIFSKYLISPEVHNLKPADFAHSNPHPQLIEPRMNSWFRQLKPGLKQSQWLASDKELCCQNGSPRRQSQHHNEWKPWRSQSQNPYRRSRFREKKVEPTCRKKQRRKASNNAWGKVIDIPELPNRFLVSVTPRYTLYKGVLWKTIELWPPK